jgi:chromosome segregation ATPase
LFYHLTADFEADYETLRHKVDDIMREKAELETQIVMLEAGKASIEYNADRILERDNTLSGEYDKLRAELKKATRALAESEDEINHLTRRLDFLKNEAERLTHDNAALKDAIKFSQAKNVPEPCSKKRKTLFDFIPGET